jgi:hypothetical protein
MPTLARMKHLPATAGDTASPEISDVINALAIAIELGVRAVKTYSFGAGTNNIDAAAGGVFEITLTASTGQLTVINPTLGQGIDLITKQTGAGSFTVTWPTNFRWAANTAPTLTTTAGRQDNFQFRYDGTNWVEASRVLSTVTA